jgi:spore coat polysaccharide biosynthesis predicted glycosyltransferase SpsG
LAKILQNQSSYLDIYFSGTFTEYAVKWILSKVKVKFCNISDSKVAIYDRMDDTENPEIISNKDILKIKNKSKNLIVLANGRKVPELIDGITIIGYKLGQVKHNPPNIYWGLDYAPVNTKNYNKFKIRDKNKIFIALGGAKDTKSTEKVLKAVSLIKQIKQIDILDSPVNPIDKIEIEIRNDQKINYYKNIPSVDSHLIESGIVLASYGHLGYEALAFGAPLCLIGHKKFQTEYANYLSKELLCISAGFVENISVNEIKDFIEQTLKNSCILSKNAKNVIDGLGLTRIANIINEKLNYH